MIGIKVMRGAVGTTWMTRVLLSWLLVNGLLIASMTIIQSI